MSLLDVRFFSNDLLLNGLDIIVPNIGHMILREGHNRKIEWDRAVGNDGRREEAWDSWRQRGR